MTKMSAKYLIEGVGKPVSKLALGTHFYNISSIDTWFGVLDTYVGFGGTVIDTARSYGTSEDIVGQWMDSRSMREHVVIITKCGVGEDFATVMREELKASLAALRTDYVDVYMLHRDNPMIPVAEILDPLNNQITEGHVRALGASNWEYRRIIEANEYARKQGIKGFAMVSNNISLAVPAAGFYPYSVTTDKMGERWHEETGIPLIPWSSQARGFFTGQIYA